MKKNFLILFFLAIAQHTAAQRMFYKIPDSLSGKNYEYLDDKIYELEKDSTKALVYIFTYIHKAKKEKNWKELVYGYQNLLHESPEKKRLIYADSMIYAAKKTDDNALIGSAYLSKGIVYYSQKKHNEALDNYIVANNYISRTDDTYLIYKVKHQIAQIKYYLGFYDEAISLFKECVAYFKNENSRAYLNAIHSLGLCYNKIGDYNMCSKSNRLGLSEGKRLENKEMDGYFIHSEGINDYFQKNYPKAIKNIELALKTIAKYKDFANESVGNFYIGKSYWALNNKNKALSYFKKVDKTFNDKGYLRPDLREVYELLIVYYKGINNIQSQLYYIDQLLKADTMLTKTYKYLIGRVHKEYDTKQLLIEREKIRKQLIREKYYDVIFVSIIIILFIIIAISTYKHFKNREIYKQKFEEMMLKTGDENKNRIVSKIEKIQILDINPEKVAHLLKQLEKFELDKKFLDKDISLASLASSFNSNTKYLSIIISHFRDKTFVEYINNLKIDYVIHQLKVNKTLRNYTNAALAEEAGFSSTQRFVHAFKARTGMPTAYFIEQIKKKNIQ